MLLMLSREVKEPLPVDLSSRHAGLVLVDHLVDTGSGLQALRLALVHHVSPRVQVRLVLVLEGLRAFPNSIVELFIRLWLGSSLCNF